MFLFPFLFFFFFFYLKLVIDWRTEKPFLACRMKQNTSRDIGIHRNPLRKQGLSSLISLPELIEGKRQNTRGRIYRAVREELNRLACTEHILIGFLCAPE